MKGSIAFMDFLKKTLNIRTEYSEWGGKKYLPYFMLKCYEFEEVCLDDYKTIFMYIKDSNFEFDNKILKHIEQVHNISNLPVVMVLSKTTYRNRQMMIKHKIPFIVRDKQLYLPFLGIVLQERFNSIVFDKDKDILTPTAQLLLFHIIYNQIKNNEFNDFLSVDVAKKLDLSPMTMSRAVNRLSDLQLISVKRDGVKILIIPKERTKALFDISKSYFINPIKEVVRKTVFATARDAEFKLACLSGETALSFFSMLNAPTIKNYAIYYKEFSKSHIDWSYLDEENLKSDNMVLCNLELWRYNLRKLPQFYNVVDPLSLYASFVNNKDIEKDERVQYALDEMLKKLWNGELNSVQY